MRIRGSILTAGWLVALATGTACTHASGKLMVDSPKMLPYQAPDIDDITGIDSSDDAEAPAKAPAQNPQK